MWLRIQEPAHIGIWVKGEAATAHSKVTQFMGWEPILFFGDNWARTRHMDVFDYSTSGREDHPAAKPMHLWTDLIQNFCEKDKLVFDPFLGSGTTLIAAEQLGRTCYGIDIEPRYVDVAVKRWENLTGRKAVRIASE
jgi:DNA modification methylase